MELFVLIIVNLSLLGVLITTLISSKLDKTKSSFAFILVTAFIWNFANYASLTSPLKEDTLFWIRAVMSITSVLAISLVLFSNYFPDNGDIKEKSLNYILIISAIITSIISLSDLVIKDILISDGTITPEPGIGIILYLITILTSISYTSRNIYIKYREMTGRYRLQLAYMNLGLTVTFALAIITNFVFVFLLENSSFVALGPAFLLIFIFFVFIAIVRTRLFDIKFIIGNFIFYATNVIYLILFFTIFYLVSRDLDYIRSIILSVPIILMIIFSLRYFENNLSFKLTYSFFNSGYNLNAFKLRLSEKLTSTVDQESITNAINESIQQALKNNDNEILYIKTNTELKSTLKKYNITTSNLVANKQNLIQYDLYDQNNVNKYIWAVLKKFENISVLMLIGTKPQNYPMSQQDIELINNFIDISAAAFQRSLLYQEVQNFAETLQEKVDQATSDLQKTNDDLNVAIKQIQEARRQERDMIDVMGHELRTPISIVRNALVMLEREYKHNPDGNIDPAKLEKYLEMGLESSRREITLIETLLSATKVDASRLQLNMTEVDVVDAVNDAYEGNKELINQKKLKFEFHPKVKELLAYADRTRSQEIMDNFVSNAAKYTPSGSIFIDVWKEGEYVWTRIKDTGMGIGEDDLENLGKKFFRAKQYVGTHKKDEENPIVRPGGTGLGLYVTFELIRAMGGKLYINSVIGDGTAFTFSLPAHTGQKDNQIDQTFNKDEKIERKHIYLNKEAPQPK